MRFSASPWRYRTINARLPQIGAFASVRRRWVGALRHSAVPGTPDSEQRPGGSAAPSGAGLFSCSDAEVTGRDYRPTHQSHEGVDTPSRVKSRLPYVGPNCESTRISGLRSGPVSHAVVVALEGTLSSIALIAVTVLVVLLVLGVVTITVL